MKKNIQQSLAKFHAASLAMKSMRIKEFRALVPKLKNHLYGDENLPSFRMMMESAVSESMSSLAKHSNSNGEFDDVIEMFTRVGGKRLHEVIKDELIYDKTDVWNVMCHGNYSFIHSFINAKLSIENFILFLFSTTIRWFMGQQSHVLEGKWHSQKLCLCRLASFSLRSSYQRYSELYILHNKSYIPRKPFRSAFEHLPRFINWLLKTNTLKREQEISRTRNRILSRQHKNEIPFACVVRIWIIAHCHSSSYLRFIDANHWILPQWRRSPKNHDYYTATEISSSSLRSL